MKDDDWVHAVNNIKNKEIIDFLLHFIYVSYIYNILPNAGGQHEGDSDDNIF